MSFKIFYFIIFMYIVFCLHEYMCAICVIWCLQMSADGIRGPGTGDTDVLQPICGCWELNPSPPP